LICGTAAGAISASKQAYYAGPGNKFWRILHSSGITNRELQPAEYKLLLHQGVGLTDLAKHAHGTDAQLPHGCFDAARLRHQIETIQPKALAFNGKKAASVFYGVPTVHISFGRQHANIGGTAIYVLPSTSAAANGHWSAEPWYSLAKDLQIIGQAIQKPYREGSLTGPIDRPFGSK
jgi:double-stranded uracil-DNA glycosylase